MTRADAEALGKWCAEHELWFDKAQTPEGAGYRLLPADRRTDSKTEYLATISPLPIIENGRPQEGFIVRWHPTKGKIPGTTKWYADLRLALEEIAQTYEAVEAAWRLTGA